MTDKSSAASGADKLTDKLPLDSLKDTLGDYARTLGSKALEKAGEKVSDLTDKLTDYADGGAAGTAAAEGAEALAEGDSPAKAGLKGLMSGAKEKVKEAFGGGGGGGMKFMNIVESVDVGVPLTVAYNQWTEFEQWSDFMKKVEHVEHQEEDGKVNFKGQVFLSHRRWESTITEQVPDSHIVWTSVGDKGHLDGAVTFHPLAERLTRILVVVEYHPQGFFEKTANIWRAVGRRLRLELKFYVHHVMTTTILDPDSVEGWRGEIRDKEIVRTHEEVLEDEADAAPQDEEEAPAEPEDEAEYEDEPEEEPEDEPQYEDEEEEEPPRRRRAR